MTFDLTREPWVPVVRRDGLATEVSLTQLFAEAETLRRLAIAFAPERVAMTRLLVAIFQSANPGPRNNGARVHWLTEPADAREAVLDYLVQWRHRFDVFDPDRPFMQQPVDPSANVSTIASLKLDWASGNNVTLFDHSVDALPAALTAAEAVRALLTTLLYQPGGGVSKPFNRTDSPGSKGLMVLAEGSTLWETMVINTPRRDPHDSADDRPIWEREPAQQRRPDKAGSTPRGWLERATWQSRAVRLARDEDGLIRTCRMNQHLKLLDAGLGDPFIPIKLDKDGERKIVRLSAGRRLWRSADAVLLGMTDEIRGTVGRAVATDAAATLASLEPPRAPQLLVVGLQVDQAKVGDSQSANLPVTDALLQDPDRIDSVRAALVNADAGARVLGLAIGAYQQALGRERDTAEHDHWRQPYWALIGAAFSAFVHDAGSGHEPLLPHHPRVARWKAEIVAAAEEVQDVFVAADTKSRGHDRAVAKARVRFAQALVEFDLVAAPPSSAPNALQPATSETS